MEDLESDVLEARLELAIWISHEAGARTLRHFRSSQLTIERKSDDSPVTIADREAENLLRERIAGHFPEDAILGEEFGESTGTSGFKWVLDPIDGTKSFIYGVPLFATLVAVLEDNTPRIGVIHAPALEETVYAATGKGCWYIDRRHTGIAPRQTTVSDVDRLEEALLLTSEVESFRTGRKGGSLDVYLALQQKARVTRTWGDAYGYLLVATGRGDVMIDPLMHLWDVAPLQPIIEEAGGRFADWQGTPTVHSGEAIATNAHLMSQVLELTQNA